MDIDIYTDGSCLNNPGPGAWGFLVLDHQSKKAYAGSEFSQQTTNNQMEMLASIKALNFIKQNYTHAQIINLHTDSQYLKNGINLWILNWKKNNWKTAARSPVKNQELWQALDDLNISLAPNWLWVKAHAANDFNNFVDAMANGTAKRKKNCNLEELTLIYKNSFSNLSDPCLCYQINLI